MQTSTRREIAIEKYGAASTLAVRENGVEAPGDDDVAIDVAYSGINFADIQMRLGFYPDAPKRPFIPGYEVSGVVAAVGKNVSHVREGDEVVAGTFFGGYASRVTVPGVQVFALPKNTDLAQGAAIPVNYFTAQLALFEMARVRAGDKVLIECATGGVGTLAMQMARHVGAEVVGLTTSPTKLDYIRERGATAYTLEQLKADPSITGFDFILNASGGAEIKPQLARLQMTGRMVCIGLSSGVKDGKRSFLRMGLAALRMPRLSVIKMFDSNIGLFALNALHVLEDPTSVARLTASVGSFEEMGLEPHVGKIFAADQVADAHEYLQTRKALGKVLLEW
jgi:2-desacetyl-2-hydroxyethyl bacteriochlorophyllide A dehydrogenase